MGIFSEQKSKTLLDEKPFKRIKKDTASQKDEDDEKDKRRKPGLDHRINEYAKNFSIHGFSKIFSGHLLEASIWLMAILLSITAISLFVHGLISKYTKKEVYLEFKTIENNQDYVPRLTVCFDRKLSDSFCGVEIEENMIGQIRDPNYCTTLNKHPVPETKYVSRSFSGVTTIFGHVMNLTTSYPGFDVHQVSERCFQLDLTRAIKAQKATGGLRMKIEAERWRSFEVIIHEDDSFPLLTLSHIRLPMQSSSHLMIERSVHIRLPDPFPSKCREKSTENIFPGKTYSRKLCRDSLRCISAYENCGNTFDFCRVFIPKEIRDEFTRNRTNEEFYACLIEEQQRNYTDICTTPCHETSFRTYFNSMRDVNLKSHVAELTVTYPMTQFYTSYEEKELYTFDQLLGEAGGVVGMFLGCSILSLVEIIVFLILVLVRRARAHKRKLGDFEEVANELDILIPE